MHLLPPHRRKGLFASLLASVSGSTPDALLVASRRRRAAAAAAAAAAASGAAASGAAGAAVERREAAREAALRSLAADPSRFLPSLIALLLRQHVVAPPPDDVAATSAAAAAATAVSDPSGGPADRQGALLTLPDLCSSLCTRYGSRQQVRALAQALLIAERLLLRGPHTGASAEEDEEAGGGDDDDSDSGEGDDAGGPEEGGDGEAAAVAYDHADAALAVSHLSRVDVAALLPLLLQRPSAGTAVTAAARAPPASATCGDVLPPTLAKTAAWRAAVAPLSVVQVRRGGGAAVLPLPAYAPPLLPLRRASASPWASWTLSQLTSGTRASSRRHVTS